MTPQHHSMTPSQCCDITEVRHRDGVMLKRYASRRRNDTAPQWRGITTAKPYGGMTSKYRNAVMARWYGIVMLQRLDGKVVQKHSAMTL
jgi:hypothetical protein